MRFFCLCVVLLILDKSFAVQLKQAGAKVTVCNYEYVTGCSAITRRLKRGEPYKTNLTIATRHPWGNNVTMRAVMYNGIPIEVVKSKLCEISKIKWLSDYIHTFSSARGDCPYTPGPYGFFNMVFPPKNMPQPLLNLFKGNFHAKFILQITKTEEIIVESTLMFYGLV